jgi:hypothetical protein
MLGSWTDGVGDSGGSGLRGGAHPIPRLCRGRARTWVVTTRIWARTVGCTHVAPSQDVRAVSQDQLQTSRQMGRVTTNSISVGVAAANKCAGERVREGGGGGGKVYWMVGVCYLLSHLAVRRHNHGHRSAACGHAKKRSGHPESARSRERQGQGSVAGSLRPHCCQHLPGAFDGSGRLAGFPPPCAPPCARGKEGGQDCHAARLWQMQMGEHDCRADQGNPQRTRLSGTCTPR